MQFRGNPTVEVYPVDGTVARGTAQRVHQQENLRHWSFGMVMRHVIWERVHHRKKVKKTERFYNLACIIIINVKK